MSVRTPSYRLHKPTNQAVVTIDGRDYYLGAHGSPKSRAETIASSPNGSLKGGDSPGTIQAA